MVHENVPFSQSAKVEVNEGQCVPPVVYPLRVRRIARSCARFNCLISIPEKTAGIIPGKGVPF